MEGTCTLSPSSWPVDMLPHVLAHVQDKYPHLTIEQSVYWSLVTVTTIGYGDFTPSITASQMTLLAMLLIAFTLLPYQVCTQCCAQLMVID